MASTFTSLTYHIIFSTKYRRKRITSDIKEELYNIIGGILRNHDGKLLEIGGVEDHVHLLAAISPKVALSDIIRLIKANSSKWTNEHSHGNSKFQWQTGFAAFTVSQSKSGDVRHYIRRQETHHKTQSFEEELLEFLKRHNIDYDPRYVFEHEHVA